LIDCCVYFVDFLIGLVVVGVVVAILLLLIGLNVIVLIYIRKRKQQQTQQTEMSMNSNEQSKKPDNKKIQSTHFMLYRFNLIRLCLQSIL
jgi:predicted membrane protein